MMCILIELEREQNLASYHRENKGEKTLSRRKHEVQSLSDLESQRSGYGRHLVRRDSRLVIRYLILVIDSERSKFDNVGLLGPGEKGD
jgi:hypothetical protein